MSAPRSAGSWKRRIAWAAVLGALAVVAVIVAAHAVVGAAGDGKCFADIAAVPKRPVAMVLGCPKLDSWSKEPSAYYANRLAAAAALLKAGRCERVLVSSDADAARMVEDLAALGVPRDRMLCDPQGVRTRDSFLSARARFGITGGIVVSQRYHNERSLYIADELGQDWVGYDAGEVAGVVWWRAHGRECLARVKAMLDRHVLRDPRPLARHEPELCGKK